MQMLRGFYLNNYKNSDSKLRATAIQLLEKIISVPNKYNLLYLMDKETNLNVLINYMDIIKK